MFTSRPNVIDPIDLVDRAHFESSASRKKKMKVDCKQVKTEETSMQDLSDAILQRIPTLVGNERRIIVDVANVTLRQLKGIVQRGWQPILVSKELSFNKHADAHRIAVSMPQVVWIVLRVPHRRAKCDDAPKSTSFDRKSQRFVSHRTRSPHLVYHPRPKVGERACSIRDSNGREVSDRKHVYCEIDDALIAHLASRLRLGVYTNDRALKRAVRDGRTPRIGRETRTLLSHVGVSILFPDGEGGWIMRKKMPLL